MADTLYQPGSVNHMFALVWLRRIPSAKLYFSAAAAAAVLLSTNRFTVRSVRPSEPNAANYSRSITSAGHVIAARTRQRWCLFDVMSNDRWRPMMTAAVTLSVRPIATSTSRSTSPDSILSASVCFGWNAIEESAVKYLLGTKVSLTDYLPPLHTIHLSYYNVHVNLFDGAITL